MAATCDLCLFHKLMLRPGGKGSSELIHCCTYRPPQLFCVGTNAGFAMLTSYPEITQDWPSCGDYDTKSERPLAIN